MSLEDNATASDIAGDEETQVTDTENGQENNAESENLEKPAEKTYTQAELDAQMAKLRRAEQRRFERRLERLEQRTDKQEPEPIADFDPENVPKKAGETDAQWIARIAKMQLQHDRLESEREAARRQVESSAREFQASVDEFYDRAEAVPGFDREEFVAYVEDFKLSDDWAEAIVTTEGGDKVAAYYLANPKEFERLAKMGKLQQVADIGRVQAKLEKQIKKAVDPLTNVKGSAIPINRLKNDPDSLTDAEWAELTRKERQKAMR